MRRRRFGLGRTRLGAWWRRWRGARDAGAPATVRRDVPLTRSPAEVLALQRLLGNQVVQGLLAAADAAASQGPGTRKG